MNKLKQFFKKLSDKILYYNFNPKLSSNINFYAVFIVGSFILISTSVILGVSYPFIHDNNVAVMIFELTYAFTGGYMLAYWFFNKERGGKKYSRSKFLDALADMYQILIFPMPDGGLYFFNFWRATYFCDLAIGYLKDYNPSKIEDVLKMTRLNEEIKRKFDGYRKLFDDPNKIPSEREIDHVKRDGEFLGKNLKKDMAQYWPMVEFLMKKKKRDESRKS